RVSPSFFPPKLIPLSSFLSRQTAGVCRWLSLPTLTVLCTQVHFKRSSPAPRGRVLREPLGLQKDPAARHSCRRGRLARSHAPRLRKGDSRPAGRRAGGEDSPAPLLVPVTKRWKRRPTPRHHRHQTVETVAAGHRQQTVRTAGGHGRP